MDVRENYVMADCAIQNWVASKPEVCSSTVIALQKQGGAELLEKSLDGLGKIAQIVVSQANEKKGTKLTSEQQAQDEKNKQINKEWFPILEQQVKMGNDLLPHNAKLSPETPWVTLEESQEIQVAAKEAEQKANEIYRNANKNLEKANNGIYSQIGIMPSDLPVGSYDFENYENGKLASKVHIVKNSNNEFYQWTSIYNEDGGVTKINSRQNGIIQVAMHNSEFDRDPSFIQYSNGSVTRYVDTDFICAGKYKVVYMYTKNENGENVLKIAHVKSNLQEFHNDGNGNGHWVSLPKTEKIYLYEDGKLKVVELNRKEIYSNYD